MDVTTDAGVEAVKAVVLETLGIEDRAGDLAAETPLFGSVPELDSLAVMEVFLALEERFGIEIQDDDLSADILESLATLTAFVNGKLG